MHNYLSGEPVDFEHADALNQAIRLLSLRH